MTTNPTGVGPFDTLDAQLLTLDPDVESLFAEVEQILCEARRPLPVHPGAPMPVPRHQAPASTVASANLAQMAGRRPATGRATQRGPPPRSDGSGSIRTAESTTLEAR
ncbi:hypothetical protein ACLMAJ_25940 [Nocardia sp. KC 131]|uniref:hypothetical protein n=1 Tax=Nocardia arseniciresistens TaxID=3392119 RepID=UPI00398F2F1F